VAREGADPSTGGTTPLRHLHEDLGARFTDFAGYEMPLQFDGILEEHQAVREQVGVFDISHMSHLTLPPGEAEDLAYGIGADVTKLGAGEAQYTVVLREDGTIIDDVIVYRLPGRLHVVPNAGMNEPVGEHLTEHGCEVLDRTGDLAMLAVQGPEAAATLNEVFDLEVPGRFDVRPMQEDGGPGFVSGTGYTGEDGVELVLEPEQAEDVWTQLVDAGVQACGLGARDTLRLEKGFCLSGNEFDPPVTPVEAGLGWTLDLDHDFVGREEVLTRREAGPEHVLVGVRLDEKGVPRRDCSVSHDSEPVGRVSSGSMSPTLEVGIALAYVEPEVDEPGTDVEVEVRGRTLEGHVAEVPFL
jgi:aminomethyltransferase